MRRFLSLASLAMLSGTVSAGTVYQVDFVNIASSGMVTLEVARPGSDRFHPLAFGAVPLAAGKAATITIRKGGEEGCLRDLRIGFDDGHVSTYRDFDICRFHWDRTARRDCEASRSL